jgi:hypothetical protein
MPTEGEDRTGRAPGPGESSGGGLLQSVVLLALPVLAFHRNMLDIVRTGIDKAGVLKPVRTLAENELHALLMLLDPSGNWRNSLGADMEKKLKDTLDAAVPKMISGSVSLIEAQHSVLEAVIEALNAARSNKPSDEKGQR